MNPNSDKGISLVIFFLVTMVAGSIPILLFSRCWGRLTSRRGQTVISLLNCFAGGVFLATCLLNLLVEGLEEYEEYKAVSGFDSEYPFFHLGIGVGFFAVAFVERLAVFLYGRGSTTGNGTVNHEAIEMKNANGEAAVKAAESASRTVPETPSGEDAQPSRAEGAPSGCSASADDPGHPAQPVSWQDVFSELPAPGGHDHAVDMTGHSAVTAVTVLLALSFHTIFDGLAVGLQETEADIWTTTAAINVHKTIVAVSLGLKLGSASPGKPWKAFLLLFLFALMAPLGVAIGIGVTSDRLDQRAHLLAGGILQGVATGSFLYVTFFEILGEELGHHSTVPKIGLTIVGFGVMAIAKIWDSD
ncbi:zinc transporter ZIP1-like [Babylonia areolata]|uniref:zinc transporter ZIP1-like n=1 Tax=Babylonia areolata TaxID=304850 RepID=UPI003FD1158F